MFSVECEASLPIQFIEITSLWVRGALGHITVWTSPGGWEGKHASSSHWTKIHDAQHPPSRETLCVQQQQGGAV